MVLALIVCNFVLFVASIYLNQSICLDVKAHMPSKFQKNYEYLGVMFYFIYEGYVPYHLQKRYFIATTLGAITGLCPFVESIIYQWKQGTLFFLLPALASIWTICYNIRHFKRHRS
jgi:hypothetical protein